MEKKLAGRLEAGLKAWTHALLGKRENNIDHSMDTDDEPKQPSHKPGGEPKIKVRISIHDKSSSCNLWGTSFDC